MPAVGMGGQNKVQIPVLLPLQIPFRKPNIYFARLQNVEITLRTADGDFPNLQQVAYEKRRGTELYGTEISGASQIHSIHPYTVDDESFLLTGVSYSSNELDSGSATSGVVGTLTDTSQSWTVNEYQNKYLTYVRGSKTYKVLISSNTSDVLTFIKDQDEAPVASDTYSIYEPDELFKSTSVSNTSVQDYLAPDCFVGGEVFSSYTGTAVLTGGDTSLQTGTATGGTVTTLIETSAGWTVNAYSGKVVKWTNSESEDFYKEIESNTSDTLTFVGEVSDDIKPVSGNVFNVFDPSVPYFTGTWSADAVYNEQSVISELTDSTAHWKEGELVGREVYINLTDSNYSSDKYTITKNTTTKIWIDGNVEWYIDSASTKQNTALSGKTYKVIEPSELLTFQDSSLDMEINKYSGYVLRISAGKGAGQIRDILGNDSSVFTLTTPWYTIPDITSQYEIYKQEDKKSVFYYSDGYKLLTRYDGSSSTELENVPAGQQVISFAGRAFVTLDPNNPRTIWYSEVKDSEFFPKQNYITPDGNDKITGIIEWNKRLIIFKERSVWEFEFTFDSTTQTMGYNLNEIPASEGCVAPRTIAMNKEYVWYLSSNYEVHRLGAHETQLNIMQTQSESFYVDSLLDTISKTDVEKCTAIYDGRFYFLSVPISSSTTNNFIFAYDSKYEDAWLTRTGNNFASFAQVGNTVYAGGAGDGKLRTLHSSTRCDDYDTDDTTSGTAIDQVIKEKLLDMGNPFYHKKFEFQDISFENTGAKVSYSSDIYRTNGKFTITGDMVVGNGAAVTGALGDVEMGDSILGGVGTTRKIIPWRKTISKRGYQIQTSLSNNVRKENMILLGSTHWYTTTSLKDFPIANVS